MFNPALTTCASERMKTQRFSYFATFAARERMREAKPVKLKKVAFSHFFDTLKRRRLKPAALSLSKKSGYGWAFSHFYGTIRMGDERCLNEENWTVES